MKNPSLYKHPVAKLNMKIIIVLLKILHTLQMIRIQNFIMCDLPCLHCRFTWSVDMLRTLVIGLHCTRSTMCFSTETGCHVEYSWLCGAVIPFPVICGVYHQTLACTDFSSSENAYDICQLQLWCYLRWVFKWMYVSVFTRNELLIPEVLYFSDILCVWNFFILFHYCNKKEIWIHHTLTSFYNMCWLIELSSGIWFVYVHLYWSASIPTLASVYILEWCFFSNM
jgi:hypothetical protein